MKLNEDDNTLIDDGIFEYQLKLVATFKSEQVEVTNLLKQSLEMALICTVDGMTRGPVKSIAKKNGILTSKAVCFNLSRFVAPLRIKRKFEGDPTDD